MLASTSEKSKYWLTGVCPSHVGRRPEAGCMGAGGLGQGSIVLVGHCVRVPEASRSASMCMVASLIACVLGGSLIDRMRPSRHARPLSASVSASFALSLPSASLKLGPWPPSLRSQRAAGRRWVRWRTGPWIRRGTSSRARRASSRDTSRDKKCSILHFTRRRASSPLVADPPFHTAACLLTIGSGARATAWQPC